VRIKFPLNLKGFFVSFTLNAMKIYAAAKIPCEFCYESVTAIDGQTGLLLSCHSRSDSVLHWQKLGLMMHYSFLLAVTICTYVCTLICFTEILLLNKNSRIFLMLHKTMHG